MPVHTILEVVRVSPAMELLRVLPSAEDEVNAAAFHPLPVRLPSDPVGSGAQGLGPWGLWALYIPALQPQGPRPAAYGGDGLSSACRCTRPLSLLAQLQPACRPLNTSEGRLLQGGGLAYGTKEGRLRLLRTEHGSPRPPPKSASPPASGDESPTAPPPPRGMEHGGGDSDDSEDDTQMPGSRGMAMSATSIAAMLAPMSP